MKYTKDQKIIQLKSIVELLNRNHTHKQIAEKLGLSKQHVSDIMADNLRKKIIVKKYKINEKLID